MDICRENGITVNFRPVRYMLPDKFSGYFDWENKTIDVAQRSKSWFQIFVHEYCHLEQALDGLWLANVEARAWSDWDDWINGEKAFTDDYVKKITKTIQECELDCERRVVKYVKKLGFSSINLESYQRSSNVYVLSYEAARQTGIWVSTGRTRSGQKRKAPFPRDTIAMGLVPGNFIRRVDKLPPGFLDRYRQFGT